MWSRLAQVVPQSFHLQVRQRLFVLLRPMCSLHRWLYRVSGSGKPWVQSCHWHFWLWAASSEEVES